MPSTSLHDESIRKSFSGTGQPSSTNRLSEVVKTVPGGVETPVSLRQESRRRPITDSFRSSSRTCKDGLGLTEIVRWERGLGGDAVSVAVTPDSRDGQDRRRTGKETEKREN